MSNYLVIWDNWSLYQPISNNDPNQTFQFRHIYGRAYGIMDELPTSPELIFESDFNYQLAVL